MQSEELRNGGEKKKIFYKRSCKFLVYEAYTSMKTFLVSYKDIHSYTITQKEKARCKKKIIVKGADT